MKNSEMPDWLPKRKEHVTPLMCPWELGFQKCPKCGKESDENTDWPLFSEWEHFVWCDFCKEQFPSMLWMSTLEEQEKKFLRHLKED